MLHHTPPFSFSSPSELSSDALIEQQTYYGVGATRVEQKGVASLFPGTLSDSDFQAWQQTGSTKADKKSGDNSFVPELSRGAMSRDSSCQAQQSAGHAHSKRAARVVSIYLAA
eukprot:3888674-Amphidinium_carterae.1